MYRVVGCAFAAALGLGIGHTAQAQVARVTYYQPATVYYAPPPVAYTVASPVVAPVPVVAPAPVAVPTRVVVQSPVVVEAPAPVVAYYRAPSVVYQPVASIQTRRRPILGGTVSRVRYSYVPVVYP
ncbi:MAG: hypothetical protein AAF961_10855 [Planctomycetota bacterium]